jgi:hypothetical protein
MQEEKAEMASIFPLPDYHNITVAVAVAEAMQAVIKVLLLQQPADLVEAAEAHP